MRLLNQLLLAAAVGLCVIGCSSPTGTAATQGGESAASTPSRAADPALLDEVKRKTIAYVATQNNFSPDDVVGFEATVKPDTDGGGNEAYAVEGTFQVKSSRPTNLNEAIQSHVNGRLCMVDRSKCADGGYTHTVYFRATAKILEKLDHSKQLDVSQQSSVDKSPSDIARAQAAAEALRRQAVANGRIEIAVVGLHHYAPSDPQCGVLIEVRNKTDLPLWGIDFDVSTFNAQGEIIHGTGNSSSTGYKTSDTGLLPGQTERAQLALNCEHGQLSSIARWKIVADGGHIMHGRPTEGMPAEFQYAAPDWSQVMEEFRNDGFTVDGSDKDASVRGRVAASAQAAPTMAAAQAAPSPSLPAAAVPESAPSPTVPVGAPNVSAGQKAPTYGPSFDCSQASSPTERAICSNGALAAIDLNVSVEYKGLRARVDSDHAQALLLSQRQWVKDRAARCADNVDCLMEMMTKRIPELRQVAGRPATG